MEKIICTAHSQGKTHDFKLYEDSIGGAVCDDIKIRGDSGYQGILQLNKNSETPKKSREPPYFTRTHFDRKHQRQIESV